MSLTAGLALAVLGTVLLLDRLEEIDLRFDVVGPIALGVLGVILLASGLSRPR